LADDLELSRLVRVLDRFSTNDDPTQLAFVLVAVLELLVKGLGTSTHELTHTGFVDTNQIEGVVTVVVDDLKLKSLSFLEVVCHLDLGLEIGVQVVVNSFGFADLYPLVRLLSEFVHTAHWIRFGENVHVLELAA